MPASIVVASAFPPLSPMRGLLAAGFFAAVLGAVPAQAGFCGPYADPHTVLVEAGPGESLPAVVSRASPGTTILLRPGTYKVSSIIQFTKANVTLRSKSGKRADVILDGNMGSTPLDRTRFVNEIVAVRASGAVIADLTIRYAKYHGIHAFPASGTSISSLLVHNVRIYDTGEQIFKVNSNGGSNPGWVDNGILQCSTLEFVDNSVMEPSGSDYYTGGLDVHGGRDWIVRHNVFRNIQRNGRSMEHAVHFWSRSRGTVVENNRFEDNYRAIGFGMKSSLSGTVRSYPDGAGDSPYSDHIDGIIRNNTVWNRKGIKLETGIALWNVSGTEVYHNTVWSGDAPFSSIEYRFPNTRATLRNNLVSQKVMKRDNAVGTLSNNLEYAPSSSFANAAAGDLHLASGTLSAIVDKGAALAAGKAGVDMDEQARTGTPDIGADERMSGLGKVGGSGTEAGNADPSLEGRVPGEGFKRHDPMGRKLPRDPAGAPPSAVPLYSR